MISDFSYGYHLKVANRVLVKIFLDFPAKKIKILNNWGKKQFARGYSRHVFGPCSGQGAPSARQPQDARWEAEKQRWMQPNTERNPSIFATGTWAKDWLQTTEVHIWKIVSGARKCYAPRWWNLRGEMRKLAGNRWGDTRFLWHGRK